ncbi:hypothetical protein LOD99_1328 [Oopsacas minuta]|uniref:Complexin n=1 Tax=Oopsacas minuta TaxID=111878 RepID=A0AAV7K5G7_9METZ|nr:hypothetical protein LOD99_1328 [Oopsacas minuta]
MDSISGFLVKSKITGEVKNITKELGLDDDDQGADEARRKREAEANYRKQEAKNQEKMREIEAEHMKKQEVREKKREEMRNKYGIGDNKSSSSSSASSGTKPPISKTGKSQSGDKCKVS